MNTIKSIIILRIFVSILLILSVSYSHAQSENKPPGRKGNLYFYWGWNRGWYTTSDIHFHGVDYDFKLQNVVAHDKPTTFSWNKYFNPFNVTIPQTDFRIGYYIKDNYSVSFGFDHMKYVMKKNQEVKISGTIANTETLYDGTYANQAIILAPEFLQFEHTNGLNYINIDMRRFDRILDLGKVKINLTEGIGVGVLMPKTNTTLFNKNNNDQYHISGYGISAVAAVNISFFKFLFIQSEFKNGYINMPDIRTSHNQSESASQHFFFTQFNVLFGATIGLHHKDSTAK
ncbi:MAG: hypothetical protein ABIQ02_08425 [Saprospiraceae bacterium]